MYEVESFYRAVCDQCGEAWTGMECDYWRTPGMANDAAIEDEWQVNRLSDGTMLHRCPQHWRLICSQCGLMATGTRDELVEYEWQYVDYPGFALCADCAKKQEQELRGDYRRDY